MCFRVLHITDLNTVLGKTCCCSAALFNDSSLHFSMVIN